MKLQILLLTIGKGLNSYIGFDQHINLFVINDWFLNVLIAGK